MEKIDYVLLDDNRSSTIMLEKKFLNENFSNISLRDSFLDMSENVKINIGEDGADVLRKYKLLNVIIVDDDHDTMISIKHNLKLNIV